MIALGRQFVICALAALLAACGAPAIFEDVGDDPHPPELTLLGIAIQPPGNPPVRPNFLPPGTTLTVRPFDTTTNSIALSVAFQDDGGDAELIVIRDRGIGPGSGDGTPVGTVIRPYDRSADQLRTADQEADDDGVPVGTAGRLWIVVEFAVSVEGVHRLEIWAEDSKGSRSEKTPFTVNVQLF